MTPDTDIVIDVRLLERIARMRRFEDRTLEIAKRLFIHNQPPKRVASEFGVNLQRAYAIRKEILAAAKEASLPDGWEEATFKGPREVIAKLRDSYNWLMDGSAGEVQDQVGLD